MNSFRIQRGLAQQRAILKRLGITTIFLFGSRAQGLARHHSDYDFGIVLRHPIPPGPRRQRMYQALYEILDSLVGELTNIDIVFLYDAPLHLRRHVAKEGVIVFETDPPPRATFVEQTTEALADFEPLRREQRAAILARIS